MTRINLLSSPRNISTALMYSFAQRPDTRVVDEPLYAAYLHASGAHHPGREEILASQPQDPEAVIKSLLDFSEKDVLFVKNMAHHMEGLNWEHLQSFHNIVFIRNPRKIIASYAQVIDTPEMKDVGMEIQSRLFHYLQEKNYPVVVVDSGELLKNPKKVLSAVCAQCGIPFFEEMLQWTPGARPEDGIWAKHWYANVHQSTGFAPQATSNRPLPAHLEPLALEAEALYHQLLPFAIKA
jgi:hypothetical protein